MHLPHVAPLTRSRLLSTRAEGAAVFSVHCPEATGPLALLRVEQNSESCINGTGAQLLFRCRSPPPPRGAVLLATLRAHSARQRLLRAISGVQWRRVFRFNCDAGRLTFGDRAAAVCLLINYLLTSAFAPY